MKWIDVKDRLPDKQMNIVVLIGGKLFLGKARPRSIGLYWNNPDILVIFEFSYGGIPGTWLLPQHFKEVTHWTPLEEMPNE